MQHACRAKISLDLLLEVYGDLEDGFEDQTGFPVSVDAMFAPVASVAAIAGRVEVARESFHGSVDGPTAHLSIIGEILRGPGAELEAS